MRAWNETSIYKYPIYIHTYIYIYNIYIYMYEYIHSQHISDIIYTWYTPWPFGAGSLTEPATVQPTAPAEPKAKCKAKAKAKAKSGGGKAVAEVTPKTFEELKSEVCAVLSPENLHAFPHCDLCCYFFVLMCSLLSSDILQPWPCRSWGNGLKKEMNAVSNLSLELPQNNQLRKVLCDYKKRFEDAIDEFLSLSMRL